MGCEEVEIWSVEIFLGGFILKESRRNGIEIGGVYGEG